MDGEGGRGREEKGGRRHWTEGTSGETNNIYIYIERDRYMYTYIYLSLSLSIYIYI